MYINKAQILGNITKQPELKVLPGGSNVCSFNVATNRVWTDKSSGKKMEQVEFHNITAFGKTAENVAMYMVKGSQVLVEGRLQTRKWEKDGITHYRTEVIADSVQFGAKAKTADTGVSAFATPVQKQVEKNVSAAPMRDPDDGNPGFEYPTDDINADDIPF